MTREGRRRKRRPNKLRLKNLHLPEREIIERKKIAEERKMAEGETRIGQGKRKDPSKRRD